MSLCEKGKAITYIEQTAEFDGHGAKKQLLFRYDGYSKQKLKSLKKCIESLKHLSETNMSNHIDKFEKICGQMVSCGFVPEQEEKIDFRIKGNVDNMRHIEKMEKEIADDATMEEEKGDQITKAIGDSHRM